MTGELSVLNVARGDLRFTWDKHSPEEVEKARVTIEGLQRKGYVLCAEAPDGTFSVVDKFDPDTDSYVVTEVTKERKPSGKKKTRQVRRPRTKTKAIAVGRTAGG